MSNSQANLENISAWARRRGFIFPSSEIYGGLANVYDFGPYGAQLKENLRNLWLKRFIQDRDDIYSIDSSVLLNPEVWIASGHTASFADVMVEDKVTHKRYRADHLIEDFFQEKGEEVKVDGKTPDELAEIIKENKIKSPDGNELTPPKSFNQLFQTEVGIISGEKNQVYLRGEIAQGLFMNFKNILDSMHPKLPFGIGQAGKAFRNEITPGRFTFRTLEFDLMEFEYFFDPETANWEELYEYWKNEMHDFALSLGLNKDRLRWRPHEDFERSHYSTRTEDLEYEFPWGFKEMWGVAYRTDFDLRNHQEHSGKDLRYTYPDGRKVTPHVVEPTFGLSRLLTVLMIDAYNEETVNDKTRVVLKFAPSIAPVQVAVFPLQKDEALFAKAQEIYKLLKRSYRVEFDNSGNIGKMYRKQDEIGTPFCITIDFETVEEGTITIRERDTMSQQRLSEDELTEFLAKEFGKSE